MAQPYIVFVFDSQCPRGGWQDVLRKTPNGDVWRFETFEEAAATAQAYCTAYFPNRGRFQVVDITKAKFIGSGGFSD